MSAPQYITAEEIRQRNTGDGNVTELLRTNPAVQFAGNDSSSLNQGEIKPSRISIHGASSFQNAYKLDGISFNNDFDWQKIPWAKPPLVWTAATRACISTAV